MGWISLGARSVSVTVQQVAQTGSFDVALSKKEVAPGESVTVTVTVDNPNVFSTKFSIIVKLFGKTQSSTISVDSKGRGSKSFTFTTPTASGTYSGSVSVSMYVPEGYAVPI